MERLRGGWHARMLPHSDDSIQVFTAKCQNRAIASQAEANYDGFVKVDYTVQVWNEGSQFIAHAMPLDVASSGSTPEAARNAVDEAVRLFLITASEHGTLKEVLEDSGYRRVNREWRGPAWLCIEQRSCLAPV